MTIPAIKIFSRTKAASREAGMTLMEIIIAIVVIGLAVPLITIPFSGNKDTKKPEYVVHASFIAQKHTETLAGSTAAQAATACALYPQTETLTASDVYNVACAIYDVDAATPDDPPSVGENVVGKKVTLTISRADGDMTSALFYSFFHN